MKVTQVSLGPTQASSAAGRPVLTPELLAATGARYSRNNEGLESIVAKIDFENPDKSVDSIFRMLDYGHQSIADMTPVAMFLDGISMFAAYYIFSEAPLQGGQESSTRYLKIGEELLLDPISDLGIDPQSVGVWKDSHSHMFALYERALELWAEHGKRHPEATRIPTSLLADTSEKAQKQVARMMRNYAFDRARYFIPVACATNVMMIMSSREWVRIINLLLSSPLVEFNNIGHAIQSELSLVAPRLIKHAVATEDTRQCLAYDFNDMRQFIINRIADRPTEAGTVCSCEPTAYLRVSELGRDMVGAVSNRSNRYARFGTDIRNLQVVFGWRGLSFAEIRDLNRHRTGSKYCPLNPIGFYCAIDEAGDDQELLEFLSEAELYGDGVGLDASTALYGGDPRYIYSTVLGTQYPFEHSTTADKMLYEAELRTGVGSHYRYAKHMHDLLELWYEAYPNTKGLILEGSSEPE